MSDRDAPVRRAVVLVADREAGLRAEVSALLEVCGHQVIEAATGLDALEWCRTGTVDLALLGEDLAELSGSDVLRLVRQDFGEARLPVILISRVRSVSGFADGMTLGANDYVVWPVEPVEMMARVDSALRTRVSYDSLQVRHDRLLDALNAGVEVSGRAYFERRVDEAVRFARRRARTVALVMIRVAPGFEQTLGARQGRSLLDAVSCMQRSVRAGDVCVLWDATTLAILIPSAGDGAAAVSASRVRELSRECDVTVERLAVVVGAPADAATILEAAAEAIEGTRDGDWPPEMTVTRI